MNTLQYGVYFIYCSDQENSPVKIGVTSDIDNRISNLQTGNPYVLKCKALIPCKDKAQAYNLESYLHHRFKKKRMVGEWFRLYEVNLKAILDDFSNSRSVPLIKQGFNIVKKASKEIKLLKKKNKELTLRVESLEDQMEEMYQSQLAKEASSF